MKNTFCLCTCLLILNTLLLGQVVTCNTIDSIFTSKKSIRLNVDSKVDSVGTKFFFVEKKSNQLYQISFYKNPRDTIFDFFYIDNSLVIADIYFRKRRKKQFNSIYFYKDKVVCTKKGIAPISVDSDYIVNKSYSLLVDYNKQNRRIKLYR